MSYVKRIPFLRDIINQIVEKHNRHRKKLCRLYENALNAFLASIAYSFLQGDWQENDSEIGEIHLNLDDNCTFVLVGSNDKNERFDLLFANIYLEKFQDFFSWNFDKPKHIRDMQQLAHYAGKVMKELVAILRERNLPEEDFEKHILFEV